MNAGLQKQTGADHDGESGGGGKTWRTMCTPAHRTMESTLLKSCMGQKYSPRIYMVQIKCDPCCSDLSVGTTKGIYNGARFDRQNSKSKSNQV